MSLKDIRLKNNLTQEEAAQLLGVTRRTYVNYEAGKIDESSLKYKYVVETLQKAALIDENHGILTTDQIKKICGEIFKDSPIRKISFLDGRTCKIEIVGLIVFTVFPFQFKVANGAIFGFQGRAEKGIIISISIIIESVD